MNDSIKIIDLTPDNIADYGVCGYNNVKKHKELRNKIEWFKEYYPKGLRIKALIAEKGSYQGMLEYIPIEYAHRPVKADGYLFIHCLFVGFKKEFKGKGCASALIQTCIDEAKAKEMLGVAVVTRKGSFMVNKDIFLKMGFTEIDTAKPDFSLLVLKFDEQAASPCFNKEALEKTRDFENGLTILRSPQCPYTEKNVQAILDSAKNEFNLETTLVDMPDAATVQNTPCAFGSFCLLLDGEVISHHPISRGRFENIINKRIKNKEKSESS